MKRTLEHRFDVPTGMVAVLEDEPFAYWQFGESSGAVAVSELGRWYYRNLLQRPLACRGTSSRLERPLAPFYSMLQK